MLRSRTPGVQKANPAGFLIEIPPLGKQGLVTDQYLVALDGRGSRCCATPHGQRIIQVIVESVRPKVNVFLCGTSRACGNTCRVTERARAHTHTHTL